MAKKTKPIKEAAEEKAINKAACFSTIWNKAKPKTQGEAEPDVTEDDIPDDDGNDPPNDDDTGGNL